MDSILLQCAYKVKPKFFLFIGIHSKPIDLSLHSALNSLWVGFFFFFFSWSRFSKMTFSSVPFIFLNSPFIPLAPGLLSHTPTQWQNPKNCPRFVPLLPHRCGSSQESQDYMDCIYMDAGIAPWDSSQAVPKLDLGTPYPLNYSPAICWRFVQQGSAWWMVTVWIYSASRCERENSGHLWLLPAHSRTMELLLHPWDRPFTSPGASSIPDFGEWQHNPDNSRVQKDLCGVGEILVQEQKGP